MATGLFCSGGTAGVHRADAAGDEAVASKRRTAERALAVVGRFGRPARIVAFGGRQGRLRGFSAPVERKEARTVAGFGCCYVGRDYSL